ncbi:MAG: PEP-utilizing enzyme, partial [Candidatus Omnitrophica bacterium]|nr:PEP-utilizing enzyme [Candidatus Omnitrophota bacterium]
YIDFKEAIEVMEEKGIPFDGIFVKRERIENGEVYWHTRVNKGDEENYRALKELVNEIKSDEIRNWVGAEDIKDKLKNLLSEQSRENFLDRLRKSNLSEDDILDIEEIVTICVDNVPLATFLLPLINNLKLRDIISNVFPPHRINTVNKFLITSYKSVPQLKSNSYNIMDDFLIPFRKFNSDNYRALSILNKRYITKEEVLDLLECIKSMITNHKKIFEKPSGRDVHRMLKKSNFAKYIDIEEVLSYHPLTITDIITPEIMDLVFEKIRKEVDENIRDLDDRQFISADFVHKQRIIYDNPSVDTYNIHTLIRVMHRDVIKYTISIMRDYADLSKDIKIMMFAINDKGDIIDLPIYENIPEMNIVDLSKDKTLFIDIILKNRLKIEQLPLLTNVISFDNEVWLYTKLGAHNAEIYANFSPLDSGGAIQINWIEPSTSDEGDGFIEGGSKRIELIKNILSKIGFDVESEDYFARLDKDTIRTEENISIADVFIKVISMLSKFRGLDQEFHSLIFFGYPHNREAIDKIIEQWSEHILWGRFFLKTICVYNWEKNDIKIITSQDFWRGEGAYTDKVIEIYDKASVIIRDIINKELKRLNEEFSIDDFKPNVFELIPEDKPFGQVVIDYYFNQPIKEALKNNMLVIDDDGVLHKNPNYQLLPTIRTLVRILDREDNLSSWNRCAYNISQISEFTNFRWVGKIGRYDIEKGIFYLNNGEKLAVYIFRDFQINKIDLAIPFRGVYIECNSISKVEILEKLSKEDYIEPTNLINKCEELMSLLLENGYPICKEISQLLQEDIERIRFNLKKNIIPEISTGIVLSGLPIVQGCVSGKVIFREDASEPKDCKDKILVFSSINPNDISYIKECKGILVRYGSALAHIFIIARGLNKPVVIINNLPSKGWNIKYEVFEEELGIYKGSNYIYRKNRRFENIPLELDDVIRVDGLRGLAYIFKNEQIKNIVELLDNVVYGKTNIESFFDFINDIKDMEV